MMRPWLPILALGALGLASPAPADVTARYSGVAGKYAPTLSIAVAESGQVRAEAGQPNQPGQRTLLIRRAGIDYVSAADAQGRFVARKDDMLAIVNETVSGALPTEARNGMRGLADIRFEIAVGGMETVAGRQGRVYRLRPIMPPASGAATAPSGADEEGDAPPPIPPVEIVISEDPELAPIGRETARLFESVYGVFEAVLGARPAAMDQINALLARGTLIRAGDQLRLRSVSTDAIAESAFALPGPVLTRAELRARAPAAPPGDRSASH